MSEMVERVAKAIFEQFYLGWEEKPAWPPKVYDSELRSADDWRNAVRIGLGTMREPNEAMQNGAREWSRVFVGSPIGNRAATGCWQAMIDEALK